MTVNILFCFHEFLNANFKMFTNSAQLNYVTTLASKIVLIFVIACTLLRCHYVVNNDYHKNMPAVSLRRPLFHNNGPVELSADNSLNKLINITTKISCANIT